MILSLSPSLVFFFCFTNFLLLFHAFVTSSLPPLCHGDERSALLQFKDGFVMDCQASSGDPLAYPKVESWKLHLDCCLWDGVTCDDQTGHVIGLDLSGSCLYGSINSSSTLFHLVHLLSLNLAYNNFNYSQIPSDLANLSEQTSLNLSSAYFRGRIPPNISQLSKLSALDLSANAGLVLKNPDFERLVENLTSLVDLRLGSVDLLSTIPLTLANLSSLKSLYLSYCELYGEFPIGIFQLPHLQSLNVAGNDNLEGHLPEFNVSSPLHKLTLSETSFSGELPDSIGNLPSLIVLHIRCDFFGQIPTSLGNHLELEVLELRGNNFEVKNSSSLSWVGKLTRLRFLGLSRIRHNLAFYFANLTQLTSFYLQGCEINGQIPPLLMNMTQLAFLDFTNNQLQGPIPDSVFQLRNLKALTFSENNLSGTVDLAMFFNKLKNLSTLELSYNNLSVVYNHVSNVTSVKLFVVGLGGCNLNHFPNFLRDQDELQWLDLSSNFLHGQIPQWIWNASKDTMGAIDLSNNFLIGFEQNPVPFPWSQVRTVHLNDNMLQGSIPIPPPSIEEYKIDHNNLNGHISPIICNLSALRVLDLSYNNFSGTLPPCLANFSSSIQFLNLEGNKFHGKFSFSYTHRCNLRMLSLGANNLEGKVPRSLSNCTKLEFLILGNNQIHDVFPSWLGSLQELKVLILRSNRFHGGLENHNSNFYFPELLIIDISENNFSKKLPAQYFLKWNAMKMVGAYMYMSTYFVTRYSGGLMLDFDYLYAMTLTTKGTVQRYSKVLESLVAVDFSSNNFEGGIPQVIGNLNSLRLLNLSNNNLSGSIPISLAKLRELESLDLSKNNFVGQIPQELTQLGFLSVFNVSYNHLIGPIPHGKQFLTFENNSYQNNSGLCGDPLSRKCENLKALRPSTSSIENGGKDSDSFLEFSWKPVAMGYCCGLIVGAVIGHIIVTRKLEWFLKTFRIRGVRMARGTM